MTAKKTAEKQLKDIAKIKKSMQLSEKEAAEKFREKQAQDLLDGFFKNLSKSN